MSLIQPLDHVERGKSRITFELQKDNFERYLEIFLEVFQEFEQDIIDFAGKKDVYTADGYWLDRIGDVVGEPRNGREDEPYRVAILFRIAVNNSDGTPQIMTRLVKQFTQANKVHLSERFPALGIIYVDGGNNHTNGLVDLVEQIKPVGTAWQIQSDKSGDSHTLIWETPETYQENFLTTQNTIDYDIFQVTLDSFGFENFVLDIPDPNSDQVLDRTVKDTNILAWEYPDHFEVTLDGVNFEDLILDGGEQLILPEIVGGVTGGHHLVWEVLEGSKEV